MNEAKETEKIRLWLQHPDQEAATAKFLRKYAGTLDEIKPGVNCIAGGAVADFLLHEWRKFTKRASGEAPEPKDIDIFTTDKQRAPKGAAKAKGLAVYKIEDGTGMRLFASHQEGKKQLVFIETAKNTDLNIRQLLVRFDLGCCCAAWTPGKINFNESFVQYLRTERSYISELTSNTMLRLAEKNHRLKLKHDIAKEAKWLQRTFKRTATTKIYGGTLDKAAPEILAQFNDNVRIKKIGGEQHLISKRRKLFEVRQGTDKVLEAARNNRTIPITWINPLHKPAKCELPARLAMAGSTQKCIKGQPTVTRETLESKDQTTGLKLTGWQAATAAGKLKEALETAPEQAVAELLKPNEIRLSQKGAATYNGVMLAAETGQIAELKEKLGNHPKIQAELKKPKVLIAAAKGWNLDQLEELLTEENITAKVGDITVIETAIRLNILEQIPEKLITPRTINEGEGEFTFKNARQGPPAKSPWAATNAEQFKLPLAAAAILTAAENHQKPHPKLCQAEILHNKTKTETPWQTMVKFLEYSMEKPAENNQDRIKTQNIIGQVLAHIPPKVASQDMSTTYRFTKITEQTGNPDLITSACEWLAEAALENTLETMKTHEPQKTRQ